MVQTIELEILGEVPVYLGVGIQIACAVVLGGMVGFDREKKMKAAGLRTNIMICLGATLYTVISLLNVKGFTGGPVDPNRVGAQIVSGIGFLGAGAIIQGRGSVVGMTTAATIWVVAAIGYTIGIGYPISAALFSLTVLAVLKWVHPVYRFFESEEGDDYWHIEVLSLGSVKRSILEMIKLEKIEFDEIYEDPVDKKRTVFNLYVYGHARTMDRLISDVKGLASVEKVSYHQLEKDSKYVKGSKVVEFLSNKTGSDSQFISRHPIRMKPFLSLILLLLSGQALAWQNLVPPSQKKQFEERLELLNLIASKKGSKRGRRTTPNSNQAFPQKLIEELQHDLKSSYLRNAQQMLGNCSDENCLEEDNRGALTFIDGGEQRHCYPSTNCEYYRCMENQYRCMDVGVEYFAKLARPTCEAYRSNMKKGFFSEKGKEWIFTVMVCLQKGLFEECSLNGNCPQVESNEKTCQHITEFTLKFHPGCYISSGVGVCKLPLKDQINIWRTVGPFLTKREKEEAFKVVRYCLFKTPID